MVESKREIADKIERETRFYIDSLASLARSAPSSACPSPTCETSHTHFSVIEAY
jgi:hypothetical protein